MLELIVVAGAGVIGGFVLGTLYGAQAKADLAALEARVKTLETTNTVTTAVKAAVAPKA